MRVIKTKGSDQEDWIPRLCTHNGEPYAILSHRWLDHADNEVLFANIEEVNRVSNTPASITQETVINNQQYGGVLPSAKPGFGKLQGAARQALSEGYRYVWVDTCCIDKGSSAELSEAINSMWKWYASSAKCYVYLVDVPDATGQEQKDLFAASQWWTRGWTLQELLAPRELTFFSSTWTPIWHKDMDITISKITGIDPNIVNRTLSPDSVCIAQRMSWSSARVTSRVEDLAYSLMGLFSVNMPLLYGEGEKAFIRLQKEIMKDSDDESIFAWTDDLPDEAYSGLLASRPSAFASCRKTFHFQDSEGRIPYSMTNKGLSITLPIQPEDSFGLFQAVLHCADPKAGYRHVRIYLFKLSDSSQQYARVRCREWASPTTSQNPVLRAIFIKQFHDQSPAYRKLSETRNAIRLLRVVPTEDPADLRVVLTEANVKTSRYTAISYAWGPEDDDERTIRVNSDTFKVRRKVFDILQAARREPRGELFWIDSICVQQHDLNERSGHIGIIGEVYTSAMEIHAHVEDSVLSMELYPGVYLKRSIQTLPRT